MTEIDLHERARLQGGVFTRAQAREHGMTRSAVTHRLATRRWRVVQGRVLAATDTAPGPEARWWTALLLAGPAAALSHGSAAQVWGLGVPDPGVVELVTTGGRTPTVPGARVRRTGGGADDVVDVRGLRITPLLRTVLDCLATLPDREAGALADRCWRAGTLTRGDVVRALEDRAGTPGSGRLRELAHGLDAERAWFGPLHVARVLRGCGVTGWRLDLLVDTPDGSRRVPLAFPADRLAVLVAARSGASQPELARELRGAGWTVLELSWWAAVRDERAVLAAVRTVASSGNPAVPGP